MKEAFRNKKFRKSIKIKYIDASGNEGIFEANQQELTGVICEIVELFAGQGYKLSARQLYYQLVTKDLIPNAEAVYTRILKLLTDLRYNGVVDWSAIEDRGRVPKKHPEWLNVSDLIESALAAYRLPRWSDQEYYIELYCEKQALEGVLKPIADKYHIYFGVNKGYSSASTMYDIAKRMQRQIWDGKYTRILYLGDHDASGLDMVRDIHTRVCEFLRIDEDDVDFGVSQIALNMDQIDEYDPPPNPAKQTDPRSKWYIKKYGDKSWELDALEPSVLQEVTEEAILKFIDIDKYNCWVDREEKEAEKLKAFGESVE